MPFYIPRIALFASLQRIGQPITIMLTTFLLFVFLAFMLLIVVAFLTSTHKSEEPFRLRNFLETVTEYLFTKVTGRYLSPLINNSKFKLTAEEQIFLFEHVSYYRALS